VDQYSLTHVFLQYWGAAVRNLRDEYQDVPGVDEWFAQRHRGGDTLYTILDTMHTIDLIDTLRGARTRAVERQRQVQREAAADVARREREANGNNDSGSSFSFSSFGGGSSSGGGGGGDSW
jgi:uncharacterized membrane protein YgcG